MGLSATAASGSTFSGWTGACENWVTVFPIDTVDPGYYDVIVFAEAVDATLDKACMPLA